MDVPVFTPMMCFASLSTDGAVRRHPAETPAHVRGRAAVRAIETARRQGDFDAALLALMPARTLLSESAVRCHLCASAVSVEALKIGIACGLSSAAKGLIETCCEQLGERHVLTGHALACRATYLTHIGHGRFALPLWQRVVEIAEHVHGETSEPAAAARCDLGACLAAIDERDVARAEFERAAAALPSGASSHVSLVVRANLQWSRIPTDAAGNVTPFMETVAELASDQSNEPSAAMCAVLNMAVMLSVGGAPRAETEARNVCDLLRGVHEGGFVWAHANRSLALVLVKKGQEAEGLERDKAARRAFEKLQAADCATSPFDTGL